MTALPLGRAGGGGDTASFCCTVAGRIHSFPREILLPVPRRDRAALSAALSERRVAPSRCAFPPAGDRLRLVDLALRNAAEGARMQQEEERGIRAAGGADGGPLLAAGSTGADRGVRHLQPLRDGSGGIDGRVPRREAREEVVPEILRARGGRPGRLRHDGRGGRSPVRARRGFRRDAGPRIDRRGERAALLRGGGDAGRGQGGDPPPCTREGARPRRRNRSSGSGCSCPGGKTRSTSPLTTRCCTC